MNNRDINIARAYLIKKYKAMPKYFLTYSIHQLTGILLTNGRALFCEDKAHYEIMNDLEFNHKISDPETTIYRQMGNIRIRPQGHMGINGINLEIFRKPTKSQLKTLRTIQNNIRIYMDYWDYPSRRNDYHSPEGGISKIKFLQQIDIFTK